MPFALGPPTLGHIKKKYLKKSDTQSSFLRFPTSNTSVYPEFSSVFILKLFGI